MSGKVQIQSYFAKNSLTSQLLKVIWNQKYKLGSGRWQIQYRTGGIKEVFAGDKALSGRIVARVGRAVTGPERIVVNKSDFRETI